MEFRDKIMSHCSRWLCCVDLPRGSPSASRLSLRKFGTSYLILKCVAIVSTFVA